MYNRTIKPNESLSFGFMGSGGSSADEPFNFVLKHANGEYTPNQYDKDIDFKLDTDNDGLPDWFEEISGTDKENPDTDQDGLNDCYEIMYTGTDPLKYDTDDNGICDADEDSDGDNLSNIDELNLGTNPGDNDTDGDGLSDYDEIYIYGTDPLKYDTDGDGLSDGDEIALGLNPNLIDSDKNGISDNEEKIFQSKSEPINCTPLPVITDIQVDMSISGNIEHSVNIRNMYRVNTLSSDLAGIIGAPIDISTDKDFDTAIITFKYNPNILETSPENLGILWFNEEEQFYEVMDTTLNSDKCEISMTTTHFSEYTVVDLNKWFKAWEDKIDYGLASSDANNAVWNGQIVTAQQVCDEYNNTFGYLDVMQLNNILPACEQGDLYCRTGIVQMTLKTGIVLEYDCLFFTTHTFDGIGLSLGSNNLIFPSPSGGGWVSAYSEKNNEYTYFDEETIWPLYEELYSVKYNFLNKYFIPSGQVDTTDNDKDGLYDIYELTGMRIANGQVIYTSTLTEKVEEENLVCGTDSDDDGLKDGEEIIRYDTEKGYFIMRSDPNNSDSDNDGIRDKDDPNPLEPFDDRFMLVDDFDYIPNVEYVDRHLKKGMECYNTKSDRTARIKWDAINALAFTGDITSLLQVGLNLAKDIEDFSYIETDTANNFSKLLVHYLKNNGTTYYLNNNDMHDIVMNQKTNLEHYEYAKNQIMKTAEEILVKPNSEKIISSSSGNYFKVTCYKHINCNTHAFKKYKYDTGNAADWGYAIGESLGGIVGKVICLDDETYKMEIKYYLIDTYEFPIHWDNMLKTDYISKVSHELHEYGMAKEYKIIGVYHDTVTWKKGDEKIYTNISLDYENYCVI